MMIVSSKSDQKYAKPQIAAKSEIKHCLPKDDHKCDTLCGGVRLYGQ